MIIKYKILCLFMSFTPTTRLRPNNPILPVLTAVRGKNYGSDDRAGRSRSPTTATTTGIYTIYIYTGTFLLYRKILRVLGPFLRSVLRLSVCQSVRGFQVLFYFFSFLGMWVA